jgi:hypothetical protein
MRRSSAFTAGDGELHPAQPHGPAVPVRSTSTPPRAARPHAALDDALGRGDAVRPELADGDEVRSDDDAPGPQGVRQQHDRER